MIERDRRIIEAEIARLEGLWQDAQERYGVTGSRSTDKTMTKYRVLQEALESVLNDNKTQAVEHSNARMLNQLAKLLEAVEHYAKSGRLPADAANVLTRIIREA